MNMRLKAALESGTTAVAYGAGSTFASPSQQDLYAGIVGGAGLAGKVLAGFLRSQAIDTLSDGLLHPAEAYGATRATNWIRQKMAAKPSSNFQQSLNLPSPAPLMAGSGEDPTDLYGGSV